MYNYIINPKNLKKIELSSKEGQNLLKLYVQNFIGGGRRGRTNRTIRNRGKPYIHAQNKSQRLNRQRKRQGIHIAKLYERKLKQIEETNKDVIEMYSKLGPSFGSHIQTTSEVMNLPIMTQANIDPLIVQNFVEDPRSNLEKLQKEFQFKNAAFSIFSSIACFKKAKEAFQANQPIKAFLFFIIGNIVLLATLPKAISTARSVLNIPEPITNSWRYYDVVNDIFEEQKIMLENNIEKGYRSAVDVFPVDRKEFHRLQAKAYMKSAQPVTKILEPKLKPVVEKLSDKINKVLKKREEVKKKKELESKKLPSFIYYNDGLPTFK